MRLVNFFTGLFGPVTHTKVAHSQLAEARRAMLEHEAAAEHHEAMAEMYRRRIERLEGKDVSKAALLPAMGLPAEPFIPQPTPEWGRSRN